ncbi:hypothetical protein [Companilactobacillus metriopterae]|uniref:hypothetical protein n=1 Tax=Companilactobacillus metriopterae TaxID=1909267 RepID=UPI00100AE5AA|nr:hypothetical protein [Companilactobacillus metriopterae]
MDERCKILDEYLSIKGTNIHQLRLRVDEEISGNENTIYVYSSLFEGLGTPDSDLDIYVVGKSGDSSYVKTIILENNYKLDVEYWPQKIISDYYVNYSQELNIPKDFFELKVLLRIINSIEITKNNSTSIGSYLDIYGIYNSILELFSKSARSHYEDAMTLYKYGEELSSVDELRRSAWSCAGALNAKSGNINLKEKWISKLFIENYQNKYLVNRYSNLMFYSSLSISNESDVYLDEMIELVNDMLIEISN